jgi:hypothetical protein
MSDIALQIYEESLKEQHNRNEARRIRTRVTEARKSSHRAGLRWPFELLQNALDAGPRPGRSHVNVAVRCDFAKIVFEHDGAPFTTTELAALLSGGSSKEFESEVTTGRFGTGFLVTHVLSERTSLQALLDVEGRYELFQVTLDRSGDEDAILANIKSCSGAIAAAAPVVDMDTLPSATFEYKITDTKTLGLGVDSLRQALPYLYATRPTLGRFELVDDENGSGEVWVPETPTGTTVEGGTFTSRSVSVNRTTENPNQFRILRFSSETDGPAALLLLTETSSGWRVVLPAKEAPRIYREYPVRDSTFLPISFVLDGKFEPDQERGRLLMDEHDKALLQLALHACAIAVSYATKQGWNGAHHLAAVTRPAAAFDPNDQEETDWWTTELRRLAERIARLPIVDCGVQSLPAVSDDATHADFIIPRLSAESGAGETTVERLWELMDACTELDPPRRDLARDWSATGQGWSELGVDVSLVTLSDLAEYVSKDVLSVDELRVSGDAMHWIARFLNAVGECLRDSAAADLSALDGMLPNQNQQLCSGVDLRRDVGIPERLKDICAELGQDVRGRLLSDVVLGLGQELELAHVERAVEIAIPNTLSEKEVIDDLLNYIDASLPQDEAPDEEAADVVTGTVKLAEFLWAVHGQDGSSWARRLPFISADDVSIRWTPHRMMMAPVVTWPGSARQFSDAYPPSRVLAELYAGTSDDTVPNIVAQLVAWGIAYPDPISTDTPTELKERRLASISRDSTGGVIVSGEELSQIALLQPEVLNRCQEGLGEAKALLGLILCHVAPNDRSWESERLVIGRRGGEKVNVTICPALWLADLRFRAWVPTLGSAGETIKMPATAATMKDLIDPSWLQNNDAAVRLLSRWFGFDELDLRLMGSAPDAATRQELRNGLAKLVESAGADPEVYQALAVELEARQRRKRDVARFRKLGLGVQDAIRVALESRGLAVTLVDRGFDYEVAFPVEGILDELAITIEVGPYLLEVKATTSGSARMTPVQAQTAARESARYVLCVVDLRKVSQETLDGDWTADAVEPLAKLKSDIGDSVEDTCSLVEEAKNNDVGIRNDAALRYEVPYLVWQSGVSISQWITGVYDKLSKTTVP